MKYANRIEHDIMSAQTPSVLNNYTSHYCHDPLTRFSFDYSNVIENFDSMKPAVIIAGHYCLAEHMQELSNTGDAESLSFELGAQLLSREGTGSSLVICFSF